ncbi:tetratricopeptide repeat protein [Kamptonema cortianum]|nr:tetratricopeptide repeat protein [Kamptonema cortianum]
MRKSLFMVSFLLFSSSTLAFSNDDEKESTAPVVTGSSHLDPIIDEEIRIVVKSSLLGLSVPKRSPRDQLDPPITVKFSSKEERACVQANIGTLYCNALNNTQKFAEAMKWFKKAAAQGDAEAQYSIGMLYDYGLGVPQDFTQAMRWYLQAASQNHAGAQYSIGMLYDNTKGSARNFEEAMRWYRLAAAQDHAGAQYCIGMLYDMGLGVTPDPAKAMKWFLKSAAQGHELAKENIKRLKGRTTSVHFIPGLNLWR